MAPKNNLPPETPCVLFLRLGSGRNSGGGLWQRALQPARPPPPFVGKMVFLLAPCRCFGSLTSWIQVGRFLLSRAETRSAVQWKGRIPGRADRPPGRGQAGEVSRCQRSVTGCAVASSGARHGPGRHLMAPQYSPSPVRSTALVLPSAALRMMTDLFF